LNSFRSPHKLLNEYVLSLTEVRPSDGPELMKNEPVIDEHFITGVIQQAKAPSIKNIHDGMLSANLTLQLTYIVPSAAKKHTKIDFIDVILSWILRREYIVYSDDQRKWIEHGFARFTFPPGTTRGKAVIDEPIIILNAANFLISSAKSEKDMIDNVLQNLCHPAGRGTSFEEFLVVYFSLVFGLGVRLCDVFDFGPDVPTWATTNDIELVTLSSSGSLHTVNFTPGPRISSSHNLCTALQSADDTMDWFKNPNTAMCFPDPFLGPDIAFFVRLDKTTNICVIVQVRFRNKPGLSKADIEDAVSSLELAEFYKHKVLPA
jgi:hypothetical protein